MPEEKTLLDAVLCFPVRGDEVLLARKLLKIGAGCLNGYGGGIEPGESRLEAMRRELREESGGVIAAPYDFEKAAVMDFHNRKSSGETFTCRVHVYLLRRWRGEFRSTKEIADPAWYPKSRLPLTRLMRADRIWLPVALSGVKIVGSAKYGPFQRTLIGPVIYRAVESFDDES